MGLKPMRIEGPNIRGTNLWTQMTMEPRREKHPRSLCPTLRSDGLVSLSHCVKYVLLSNLEIFFHHEFTNISSFIFVGDVAKIYPSDAPEDQIKQNKTKRVEIFKMPSGTDYALHDIDEHNVIVGKARFSGNVRVSEGISVIGLDEDKPSEADNNSEYPMAMVSPPTFHPPSFGLTVLGNSHGFDARGSTSGYVLWINGRGIMIDPPPYSSATLEREGIRPRLIVGIILTHCHADHDAGAFQKVLTGSPVVVITTPTIYKSFIRKYAALSSLSPALLRHSHRYKPAIIGEPLRFQGATFHFTYTLHTIPCVGFRVDWRGRSMVFTGDHFNNPPAIQKLTETVGLLYLSFFFSMGFSASDWNLQTQTPCSSFFFRVCFPRQGLPILPISHSKRQIFFCMKLVPHRFTLRWRFS